MAGERKIIQLRLYPSENELDRELYELWLAIKQLAREQGMTPKRALYELLSDKKQLLWEVRRDAEADEKRSGR
jgi:hypothetical protein